MQVGEERTYNHFVIYLNQWGEYCVSRKLTPERMVSWNSGFKTLKKAKQFINAINPVELPQEEIERIAEKIHKRT